MDDTEAGSPGDGLRPHILNCEDDVRLGDGKKVGGLDPSKSRACTTLKSGQIIRIGDDIEVSAYKSGGKIRVVIIAPRTMTIRWPNAKKD